MDEVIEDKTRDASIHNNNNNNNNHFDIHDSRKLSPASITRLQRPLMGGLHPKSSFSLPNCTELGTLNM